MTFVAEKGVVTFDGEVVEVFGFGRGDFSVRMHVAMLEKAELSEGGRFSDPSATFKARGMGIEGFATFTDEEAGSPELAKLVDAVRAVSPNLKQGG